MYWNWTGDSQLELERLHKKHGPIVRITPYIIDIDMPEMISTVFNIKGDWLKVGALPTPNFPPHDRRLTPSTDTMVSRQQCPCQWSDRPQPLQPNGPQATCQRKEAHCEVLLTGSYHRTGVAYRPRHQKVLLRSRKEICRCS